jgi:hypothetical protein
VRDGAGVERAAPLFYVSPTQVNSLVPAGTPVGRRPTRFTSNSTARGCACRALVGRGEVDLVLTGDGKMADAVRVSFR